MPGYFIDTSALVKYYHEEQGSVEVRALITGANNRCYISRLAVVEIHSALVRKVLMQEIDDADFSVYRQGFLNDVAAEVIHVYRTPPHYLRTAERLLLSYGTTHRLRTLDALQLAVASEAKNRNVLNDFVSADSALCGIAAQEGFDITIPA